MTKVTLSMSMSLDGFIEAADATPEAPLGVGGERLHEWAMGGDQQNADFLASAIGDIGAVVAGRRTYDASVPWWGADGPTGPARLPVYVVTHKAPVQSPEKGVYRFATEGVVAAVADAKAAAGRKGVSIMGGPDIGQQALETGCVDEISISLIPVVLGNGKSLFQGIGRHIQLEPVQVIDTPLATHLRYRIAKGR